MGAGFIQHAHQHASYHPIHIPASCAHGHDPDQSLTPADHHQQKAEKTTQLGGYYYHHQAHQRK
jgi:hypothetical protein